jgi:hypothetical protein
MPFFPFFPILIQEPNIMNDFAPKNYRSNKTSMMTKLKALGFAMLCFGVLCGLTATAAEVGHAMQMERIAAGD